MTSRLEVFRQPSWMKQWPFAHTIEMTYRLADGELEVRTTITNHSAEPMPVSIGYHPYFQLTDSTRDEWTITVPARTRWLLSAQKLPTGDDGAHRRVLHRLHWRAEGLQPRRRVQRPGEGCAGPGDRHAEGPRPADRRLRGPNYRSLVVYSPNPLNTGRGSQIPPPDPNQPAAPARPATSAPPNPRATPNFICFEPMAGISNALNLAQKGLYRELQSIAPGASWQESFWVQTQRLLTGPRRRRPLVTPTSGLRQIACTCPRPAVQTGRSQRAGPVGSGFIEEADS